jgi:uncharacterized CHY-type Zn-finger protein
MPGNDEATERTVGGHPVRGVDMDPETRCAHWASDSDVVAIRAPCCGVYYPCSACHEALADHVLEPIPGAEFDAPGVLCGACGTALTVHEYLDTDHACPAYDILLAVNRARPEVSLEVGRSPTTARVPRAGGIVYRPTEATCGFVCASLGTERGDSDQ